MRSMKWLVPLLFLVSLSAPAQDPLASDDSIRELMRISRVDKMMDQMYDQVDRMMQASMAENLKSAELNAEQRRIIDEMRQELFAEMRRVMDWKTRLEPVVIDVYRQALTQREVDGMIAFYQGEIGQALLDKMPMIMELSMKGVMDIVRDAQPRLKEIADRSAARLKAAAGPEADEPTPPQ